MKRVVVTGMAGVTALGSSWPEIHARLRARENATRYMADWERYADLDTKLAAPVDGLRAAAALDAQAAARHGPRLAARGARGGDGA